VAVIRYHSNYPSASDPFYLANTTENAARISFYGITGYPSGREDGLDIAPWPYWEGVVSQRTAVSSPLTITLNGTYNPGNRTGTVSAHIVNTSTGTVSGTLQFVVTESGINYSAPNGERIFNNTMRKMLPNASGQSISIPVSGTLDTSRAFTLGSGWVSDSCCIVVFVQTGSREIAQAAKLYIPPDKPYLAFRADSVRDTTGDRDGRLDPGEAANYFVRIVNMNPATATGVSATIASTDTFIQILSGTASYPNISRGLSQFNTTPFVVRAKPSCPYGRKVQMTITINATGYSAARGFKLNTGSPSDYIGPDPYGYYTYENLDTRFQQSPPYNWVEIDPQRGGGGALVTLGDDQTTTRTLPFSMRHYGTASTTLSLCSNGWLAVGSTSSTVNSQAELPSNTGVPGMIAAYWSDLDPSSASGGGRVSVYSDATNHRYIVEFDSVQVYTGNHTGAPQSFEYILRDPAFYPTPTGDGEIILQYQLVNGPGGGTVGIQNTAMTVGTTYSYMVPNPAAYGLANGRAIKFTTVLPTSGVESPPGALQPESPFALYGSWPNPFRAGTTINFSLPREGRARLAVYNVAGQLVRTLTDGVLPAGSQSVSWDGRDNASRAVSGGIYFYRLSLGDRTLTHKAVLVR
jgi:hypothetical protein